MKIHVLPEVIGVVVEYVDHVVALSGFLLIVEVCAVIALLQVLFQLISLPTVLTTLTAHVPYRLEKKLLFWPRPAASIVVEHLGPVPVDFVRLSPRSLLLQLLSLLGG